jgi:thiol-disulfide isomerase/thioredoxin
MAPGRRDALIVGAGALGAVVAGGLFGALALQSRSGASELLSASFVDLAGRTRRIREWQGRVVLCNFWATWCEPCKEEVPLLSAAEQKYGGKGLSVVGIAIDSAANISEFAAKYHLSYANLVADANALQLVRRLGNSAGGLPFSVLLDRNGAIAGRRVGAYGEAELVGLLEGMLR